MYYCITIMSCCRKQCLWRFRMLCGGDMCRAGIRSWDWDDPSCILQVGWFYRNWR